MCMLTRPAYEFWSLYIGARGSQCLGNILMYYGQFSDAVEQEIQDLVSPVKRDFDKVTRIMIQ